MTEVAWWEVAARAIIIWRWVSNILNRGSPHQLFAMKEHIRDYQYLIAIVQKMMAAVTSKNSGQTEEEGASVMWLGSPASFQSEYILVNNTRYICLGTLTFTASWSNTTQVTLLVIPQQNTSWTLLFCATDAFERITAPRYYACFTLIYTHFFCLLISQNPRLDLSSEQLWFYVLNANEHFLLQQNIQDGHRTGHSRSIFYWPLDCTEPE